MSHNVTIQLTPVYLDQAPYIGLCINGQTVFDNELKTTETFQHNTSISPSLKIEIKRSGRTKKIIHDDPNNGFEISNLQVNGIQINPDVGSYHCINNDYLEPHIVHGKKFDLNGEYVMEIPYFTLRGEITKNKHRFDIEGQHNKYCFFGTSMASWEFSAPTNVPPIQGKKNFAELFIEQVSGTNFASMGQTNQEIVETVYKYLDKNKCDVAFVQLSSIVGRQVKNSDTGEIKKYSPHFDEDMNCHDAFTNLKLKHIQRYFVYLDVAPILALQVVEYQKLIDHAMKRGTKVFFISYFRDEYEIYKKAFPNNVAPYFDIDPQTKYCKDNGYHAPPEEHEIYVQNLIDFIGKI